MKPTHNSPGPVRLLTLAVLLALAPAARAQTQDLTMVPLERLLEMRVIAASSYEQSTSQAPSAVSIITAEEIRRYGYRTIAEALQSLPGLFLTNDLSYEYLGLRGFNRIGDYNGRFQLSVNSLRTNDAAADRASLGNELPIDMALVERIEFAPGPGSSIYGSNAMLGVINVVTRTGSQLPGLRAAVAAGSDGQRDTAVSYGRRFASGLEVLASVSGLRGDGQDFYFPAFDTPETRDGRSTGQNGERYERAYLRASYEGLDLEVFGGKRIKSTPGLYIRSDFLSNDGEFSDGLRVATLRFHRDLPGATRFEARVSSGAADYQGVFPILYPIVGSVQVHNATVSRWRGAEARIITSAFDRHKIVAGLELQRDVRIDQRSNDKFATYLDRRDSSSRYGAYLQDEFQFRDGWLLNAGVRYDYYGTFGSSVNPRLALVGEIAPATTLKLLYGSAFRAPNAFELYYQSETFSANYTLKPEVTRSAEAVLEQQRGDSLRWRASLFHYRFADLIQRVVVDEAFVFRNEGSVTGRGAEFSAMATLPGNARGRFSASAHDVRDQTGQRLSNSPRYTAKLGLDAPLAATGLRAAVEMSVVGDRLDRDRQHVPAAVAANFVVSTSKPWMGTQFSIGAYNLFDKANPQPVSQYFRQAQNPGLGRQFRIEAEWRF